MKRLFFLCLFCLPFFPAFSQLEMRMFKDIPYVTKQDHWRQSLDVFVPESDKPVPCVIWIHGGAWWAGSKNWLSPSVDTVLYHDMAVASIGYRLSQDQIFPAQIQDVKSAIRFLKKNADRFGIDSARIGVLGESAGGHLAALAGTSDGVSSLLNKKDGNGSISSTVKAVVNLFGPTDFNVSADLPEGCEQIMEHVGENGPVGRLLGCLPEDCPERVRAANPITYITPDDPPFLTVHGTADCVVTPKASDLLHKALKQAKIQSEILWIENGGHAGERYYQPDVKSAIVEFFRENLEVDSE